MTEIHPDVEPLKAFLGKWRGRGEGSYPTIDPFVYEEESEYWHVGKAFVVYWQRTWNPQTGEPLHQEAGYLRPKPGGRVEVVLAHPTGIAEILEGTICNGRIDAETRWVGRTSTAKEVTKVRRSIEVDSGLMRYTVSIAAVGVELTQHLRCELTRMKESGDS